MYSKQVGLLIDPIYNYCQWNRRLWRTGKCSTIMSQAANQCPRNCNTPNVIYRVDLKKWNRKQSQRYHLTVCESMSRLTIFMNDFQWNRKQIQGYQQVAKMDYMHCCTLCGFLTKLEQFPNRGTSLPHPGPFKYFHHPTLHQP